jgi:hypothetical protein
METRDILNHLGVKIGELELPEGTSEDVWEEKLALYAAPPAVNINPITPRQIRLQLLKLEITNQSVVDAIVAAIPEPERTQALIEWEYSIGFDRNAPFVDAVGLLLGFDSQELDDLWLQASQL